MAIHDGDIVLGTVEEMVALHKKSLSIKDVTGSGPVRRDSSPVEDKYLWPDGVIPYVIDPGFNEERLKSIQTAIDEWNSKTVITLVERTTEADYARFRIEEGTLCSATVGKRDGGGIWIGGPEGCGVSGMVHEIGHVVGLWHEHQRVDRDEYVRVPDARTYGSRAYSFVAGTPAGGPYDYASIMHYVGMETIPPGMPMRSSRLSAGDIDGVARLYGKPPTATTISTNPPGLEIEVDGERMATPATFDWSPGSEHVLEALSPQTVGARRLVFGRWNDEANARRTVTTGAERTGFEANYIVQQRLLACADPPEAGEGRIRPESGDGYYAVGTPVEIEAIPAGARAFVRWGNDGDELSQDSDRRSPRSLPGESSNPATGSISPWWSVGSELVAHFSAEPLFRIDSNEDGTYILVNGERKWLPWAFPADAYPHGIPVEAPAIVPEDARDDVRYRFESWSGGGARSRRVTIPATGGSLSLNLTREYRLRAHARGRDETAVSIAPPSEDGFYPAGTQVVVTAVPPRGERFAGWTGEVSGSETALTVVMDAAKSVEAVFTRSQPLRPSEEQDVVLDAARRFALYSHEQGWHALVPRDAAEMTVRFQTSSAAEVDLYVNRGQPVWRETGEAGETPRIHADYESTAPGANETITISRGSSPRLTNDVYFIASPRGAADE